MADESINTARGAQLPLATVETTPQVLTITLSDAPVTTVTVSDSEAR